MFTAVLTYSGENQCFLHAMNIAADEKKTKQSNKAKQKQKKKIKKFDILLSDILCFVDCLKITDSNSAWNYFGEFRIDGHEGKISNKITEEALYCASKK